MKKLLAAILIIASYALIHTNKVSADMTPVQAGVGECGYYRNAGTEHRNGLVTPDYCSSPAPVVTIEATEENDKPETTTTVTVTVTTEPEQKNKCNKGSGNGSEGCDPGNNPDKGNDDETGTKKEKKDKK